MDTFSIYQRGVDAWTMRQIIRQRTQVDKEMPDAPSTLAGRIEWMLNEKRLLQNRWLKVKDLYPDEKQILHEEDVVTYDKVIAHFESLADDAMVGQLRSGSVLGLGYRNRSDSQPVHIPTSDWAFLKLNMRKSDATFEDGGSYKAIRFLENKELSKDERRLFDSFTKKSDPQQAKIKSSADLESKKTTSKIRTSEQARSLVDIRHSRTNALKAKVPEEALWFMEAGLNHSEIARRIEKKPGFDSLSPAVILKIVKETCVKQGRTDLVLGHPDYRKPS